MSREDPKDFSDEQLRSALRRGLSREATHFVRPSSELILSYAQGVATEEEQATIHAAMSLSADFRSEMRILLEEMRSAKERDLRAEMSEVEIPAAEFRTRLQGLVPAEAGVHRAGKTRGEGPIPSLKTRESSGWMRILWRPQFAYALVGVTAVVFVVVTFVRERPTDRLSAELQWIEPQVDVRMGEAQRPAEVIRDPSVDVLNLVIRRELSPDESLRYIVAITNREGTELLRTEPRIVRIDGARFPVIPLVTRRTPPGEYTATLEIFSDGVLRRSERTLLRVLAAEK